jgi:hypothetical protein
LGTLSEERAEECVNSGFYQIRVMIDAAASRLAGSAPTDPRYLRVLRNLRRLMKARSRLQSLQPEVALTVVLHRIDLLRLKALVRFAHDEGIGDMTVEIADAGAGDESSPSMPRQMQDVLERNAFKEAAALAAELGVTLHPLRFARDGDSAAFPAWRGAGISYSGEAVRFDVLPDHRPDGNCAVAAHQPPIPAARFGAIG